MRKSIIILVKEHDSDFNYHYSEYKNDKRVKKYSYEEVKELRKSNIVVII